MNNPSIEGAKQRILDNATISDSYRTRLEALADYDYEWMITNNLCLSGTTLIHIRCWLDFKLEFKAAVSQIFTKFWLKILFHHKF